MYAWVRRWKVRHILGLGEDGRGLARRIIVPGLSPSSTPPSNSTFAVCGLRPPSFPTSQTPLSTMPLSYQPGSTPGMTNELDYICSITKSRFTRTKATPTWKNDLRANIRWRGCVNNGKCDRAAPLRFSSYFRFSVHLQALRPWPLLSTKSCLEQIDFMLRKGLFPTYLPNCLLCLHDFEGTFWKWMLVTSLSKLGFSPTRFKSGWDNYLS